MPKLLIVTADDYGRSAGVSRGILHAHREGIVTGTTVMVNVGGVEEQVAEALRCPGLGLGAHLVYCSWKPILAPEQVPGLVGADGHLLDQHTCWARAEAVPLDQLRAELEAQIERFVSLTGRRPDHLDCHQFVHAHPRLFKVYVELAARLDLPVRIPFSTATDWETQVALAPFLKGSNPDRLAEMVEADLRLVRAARVRHPDHSVTTFFGRLSTLDNLLHLLETLPDGVSEMMCHPGYPDEALAASGYRDERLLELEILTHPTVRQRVRDLGIELVTFAALDR